MSKTFPAEVFHDFAKQEILDFLEILHYAFAVATEEDFGKVLHLITRRVPCRHLVAGQLQPPTDGTADRAPQILTINPPNGWVSLSLKNRNAGVDRLLPAYVQKGSGPHPSSVGFSNGRSHEGTAPGFTLLTGLAARKPDRELGLASFVSLIGGAASIPRRYHPALEYLAPYLHEALSRIARPPAKDAIDILSPREKAVLNWMRHGKTNWEISRILGVSERTVRFHAEGIFNKLQVTSRTQAVAYAVENGLRAAQ